MTNEGTITYLTENEMQKQLQKKRKEQDRERYGRGGYVQFGEGVFRYKGIAYIIRVLRHYNLDEGFTPLIRRRTSEHVVVEFPDETKPLVDMVNSLIEYSEFLWYDTLHSFNDVMSLQEQIEDAHRRAKQDIDSLFDDIPQQVNEKIQRLQEGLAKIEQMKKTMMQQK
jgi:hypothetical protein